MAFRLSAHCLPAAMWSAICPQTAHNIKFKNKFSSPRNVWLSGCVQYSVRWGCAAYNHKPFLLFSLHLSVCVPLPNALHWSSLSIWWLLVLCVRFLGESFQCFSLSLSLSLPTFLLVEILCFFLFAQQFHSALFEVKPFSGCVPVQLGFC